MGRLARWLVLEIESLAIVCYIAEVKAGFGMSGAGSSDNGAEDGCHDENRTGTGWKVIMRGCLNGGRRSYLCDYCGEEYRVAGVF